MAASQIGLDAVFHTDDQGAGGGTWVVVDGVGDVTINQTRNTATRKDRSLDYETYHAGQRVISVDATLTFEAGDTQMEEIRDAFTAGSDIGIGVMHTAIATVGSEGLIMDAKVTNFTRNEALEGVIAFDCTFVPSGDSTYALTYAEVSA